MHLIITVFVSYRDSNRVNLQQTVKTDRGSNDAHWAHVPSVDVFARVGLLQMLNFRRKPSATGSICWYMMYRISNYLYTIYIYNMHLLLLVLINV